MPTLRCAVSALLLAAGSLAAAQPVAEVAKAPALREIESETRELGTWDDALKVDDQDFLVLRRGEDLFTLAMNGPAEPKKMQSAERLKGTQIIAAASAGDRLWLFLNSREQAPFAFELHSGDTASFDIPGLKVPGEQAPSMSGGVFTVTNLGNFGIDAFTPIINVPETAILGIGAIRREAVVLEDDRIVPRDQMTLSLTFDHRLVDGAPAARFLADIAGLLEEPPAEVYCP